MNIKEQYLKKVEELIDLSKQTLIRAQQLLLELKEDLEEDKKEDKKDTNKE